ncbi:MAG: hypothetical protein COB59_10285 [Rhodospirillaceae bacterium]|nr:MAG: hypothetical protein COB59_10285 [Rhodospirillaceae bacterium]
MSLRTKTVGFGSKGAHERQMTFAESLLSGRPLQRDTAGDIPHLKPRPKMRFGTKGLDHSLQLFGAKPEALL